MPSSNATHVGVVGAGPAGLAAAIAAAEGGARVTVFEKQDRPGVKLLATGGGRCNLTNMLPTAELMAAFGRQGRFMQPALDALDAEGLRAWLAAMGVPTVAPDKLHVYPASDMAVTVQSALWRRCRDLRVELRLQSAVVSLAVAYHKLVGVDTDAGRVEFDRVIVAAGGAAWPALGGSGSGYQLAKQAGHDVTEPTPALVPLVTQQRWPGRCSGLSLSPGRIWIDVPGQSKAGRTGDILFTHRGLSGPAVLDISGDVAALLREGGPVPVRVSFNPAMSAADWRKQLDAWSHSGGRQLRTVLTTRLVRRLVDAVCEELNIPPDLRVAELPGESRDLLCAFLAGAELTVASTDGMTHAMVTRGGVSLKQVDPHTLASRKMDGLYFAGEVLDLDGPSGGFNLQWAFSSGRLAGMSAAVGAAE